MELLILAVVLAIVATYAYFDKKLNIETKNKTEREPTFKRILYMDNLKGTVIKWQFDLSAIPSEGDFVSFDSIENKYKVISVDYQICNEGDIVIMCESGVKKHF
jgi:hypothetical protein